MIGFTIPNLCIGPPNGKNPIIYDALEIPSIKYFKFPNHIANKTIQDLINENYTIQSIGQLIENNSYKYTEVVNK